MSSGNNQTTPEVQLTKAQMSPAEWVKIISQVLVVLVGLGGIKALWGIQDKQPSPNTPIPVVPVTAPVAPVTPQTSLNTSTPTTVVQPLTTPTYVTKDDLTKTISDSEARILKSIADQLKAFEQ